MDGSIAGSRSDRCRGGLPQQRVRVTHDQVKQEDKLEDTLRTQFTLDHQHTKARTPHSIEQTFGAVLLGSYRSILLRAVKFCCAVWELVSATPVANPAWICGYLSSFLKTLPDFITNLTRWSSVMSFRGSPETATK
jgi:hypothetical protein